MDVLSRGETSFDALRRELEVPARVLEDDLRHIDKSLRRGSTRLWVTPARCIACGFTFEDRAPRRFQAPGRCPRCRSERIAEPLLRIS